MSWRNDRCICGGQPCEIAFRNPIWSATRPLGRRFRGSGAEA